jgi:glycosyltransferase involved in cell wall biosynthesis
MTAKHFLLVSPGAIDSYPPVQYQARLLADAGHSVTILSQPLQGGVAEPVFAHPGVTIHCLSQAEVFAGKFRRIWAYCSALRRLRRGIYQKVGRENCIEISYDPIGMFYSSLTPGKPRRRILHLHELLQYTKSYLENRLRRVAPHLDAVVVADQMRAEHTRQRMTLDQAPLVIENYPLRASAPPHRTRKGRFEVLYCGAVGYNQKLDIVVRSVPLWPQEADFVIIGQDHTRIARELGALAEELGVRDRVHFTGWMDIPVAEERMAQADLGIALLYTGQEQLRSALGASNKRYQYMKAGLPQIGDQNPGVLEMLQDQRIGACVAEHTPEEIAHIVAAYVQDPDRRVQEGARAFALHQDKYNYQAVFGALLDKIKDW